MSPSPEQIRAFVAIELPEEARRGLARLRQRLERKEHGFVKWVDPEGIHLTLKFLGNIPFKRIPEITQALEQVASVTAPFLIEISGLGAFPNLKQIRVFWVGLRGEVDKLSRLQQNVDAKLATLGFAKEERAFVPHLTLARIREGASPPERKAFGELVMAIAFDEKYDVQVKSISLMRSELTPAGAIYSRLSVVGLRH